jgi:hypothetical protein
VRVSGISAGENCCDFIKIYNGTGLGGNLLWAGNPGVGVIPTITSTVGPLTIEFTSNGSSVGAGFALDIICMPLEYFVVPTSGNNTYSVCSGTLYDYGGPNFNFLNNATGYTVLNPSNPTSFIQVNGNGSGDNCCDILSIYDGAGLSGNVLWSGNLSAGTVPTITSTTGPLTVSYTTFGFVASGFSLNINCFDTASCTPTIFISSNQGTNICQGQQVIYAASITNGGSNPTYQWKRNGINVGTSSTYTSSTNNNGDVITCELTSNASCANINTVVSNSLNITVNTIATSTFTQVAAICEGAILLPLPSTSNNGIEGTWLPSLNNISTTTYTFTPNAGQCGTTANMTITVNQNILPSFTQVQNICAGSILTPLPTNSNNSISGTWTPALNNTTTTNYIFTPNAGQCGTTANMTITVNPNVTPNFTQVQAICVGEALASLPSTSNNGINGSWAPAMNNTTTTTYTFTPNSGQCVTNASMTIAVNPIITPNFTAVGPFCAGQFIAPLPTTSIEGITGTWTPAIDNNQTTNYTFSANTGQCASNSSLTIEIDQIPSVSLVLNGTALATNSGYSNYVWTFNGTAITGADTNQITVNANGIYAVTVTDANGCTGTASFNVITVNLKEIEITNSFSIFPNPSNDKTKLSIELAKAQEVKVVIIDVQGKILIEKSYAFKAGKNETFIDISQLSNGVYFIQLENTTMLQTKRLVKM